MLTGDAGGDVLIFASPTATGDEISDFQSNTDSSNTDSIDMLPVLSAINYLGDDPLNDGTISFQTVPGGMQIMLSADGNPATHTSWPR